MHNQDFLPLQVCDPDSNIGWALRSDILRGLVGALTSHPGQGHTAPEVLLEITFSLAEDFKSRKSFLVDKAGNGGSEGGESFSTSKRFHSGADDLDDLGLISAAQSLSALLVLHQSQVPLSAVVDGRPAAGTFPSIAVRGGQPPSYKTIWDALCTALDSLALSCAPYVGSLGPDSAADLATACSVFCGGVPWTLVKVMSMPASEYLPTASYPCAPDVTVPHGSGGHQLRDRLLPCIGHCYG